VSDVEARKEDAREREPESAAAAAGSAGNAYSVTLPTFEGPLDLLLHLCQKHELDILDIPIGFVTEKYLEYLAVMQLMDLDLASEYLVMAATLAHIKSKMLLPAPPPGQEDDALTEDEEDPRESLIRRLLEYQKYKQAGADLQARGVVGRDIFFRGSTLEEAVHTGIPPLAQVPLFSLVEAFQSVLAKSKIKLSHDVVHERITLTDRINELVDVLRTRRRMQFEELFTDASTRFDLVITFLALLEMTKLRMTRLVQVDPLAPIYVEFSAQVNSDDALDENATDEEKATAQAKADAEADAAADAHAREHAHEPHANGRVEAEAEAEAEAGAGAEADGHEDEGDT
jgi:segregation and condensation protein A